MREDLQVSPTPASQRSSDRKSALKQKTFYSIFEILLGSSARIVHTYIAARKTNVPTRRATRLRLLLGIVVATSGDEKDASNTRCSLSGSGRSTNADFEKSGQLTSVDFSHLVPSSETCFEPLHFIRDWQECFEPQLSPQSAIDPWKYPVRYKRFVEPPGAA